MTPELETGFFKGSGGVRLFYRAWSCPDPKAILAFCHGFAEHSNRYEFPVNYFVARGFSCYLFDLRGHGESEGVRVYAESLDDLLEDLRLFLKFVRKFASQGKIFLVGHSFGGQIALNLLASSVNGVEGAILSSPNIRLKLKVPLWKRLAAHALSSLSPQLAMANQLDPRDLSHDPDVVEAWKRDRLIQRKITARLGLVMLENQDLLPGLAGQVRLPCYFLHGGADPICSSDGTRDFYKKVGSADKELKIYRGFFHEIFNEVDREKVFRDVERWIEKRL